MNSPSLFYRFPAHKFFEIPINKTTTTPPMEFSSRLDPGPLLSSTMTMMTTQMMLCDTNKAEDEKDRSCGGVMSEGCGLFLTPPSTRLSAPVKVTATATTNALISSNSDPFPFKLHDMLENAEALGFHNIVSWEHGGEAFKVHDPERFVATVLKCYCNQTRYKSFQRQLNIYGFTRISRGADKGICYHKYFKKGQKQLCIYMERHKLKEDTILQPESIILSEKEVEEAASDMDSSSLDELPTLSVEPCLPPVTQKKAGRPPPPAKISDVHDEQNQIKDFASMFEGKTFYPVGEDGVNKSSSIQHSSSVASGGTHQEHVIVPTMNYSGLTTCFLTPTVLNLSSIVTSGILRCGEVDETEFKSISRPSADIPRPRCVSNCEATTPDLANSNPVSLRHHKVPGNGNVSTSNNAAQTGSSPRTDSFPWKLHDMLTEIAENGQDDIVSWEHNGRALKVHKPQTFATDILPNFFLHSTKWESFQRQLNLYGFTRISRGPDKGMYLHKYFVRDQRSLCRRITRKPPSS